MRERLRLAGFDLAVRALALLAIAMTLVWVFTGLPLYQNWSSGRVALAEERNALWLLLFAAVTAVSAAALAGHFLHKSKVLRHALRAQQRRKFNHEVHALERQLESSQPLARGERVAYPADWPELRQLVLDRDQYRCGNCGSAHELHVHHIVPLSLGGSNEMGNLRTLCRTCHAKLHPHMRA